MSRLTSTPSRKGVRHARRQARVEEHEDAAVVHAPDETTEGLAQSEPRDEIVPLQVPESGVSCLVQQIGPRPWHPVEDDEAQGTAGNIDAIAHGIGAEQAGVLFGAEDVHEGSGIHGVDVLRIERQPRLLEGKGDALVDAFQAPDGREDPEAASPGGREEIAEGDADPHLVLARYVRDHDHPG